MKKFLIPFVASVSLLLVAIPAFAATPLSGYAWSSNIGWLSFNSSDGSTVQLATTTGSSVGTLSGYAWSSNIGWVKFGGLAGQQVNSTINATDATVNVSTGAVSGWARAIAGVGRADGWDGWIELSGANHSTGDANGNSGVTFLPSTNKFTGYAWGSDVVGWLSFSHTDSNGSTTAVTVGSSTPSCTGNGCPIIPLTASCIATVNSSNNIAYINVLLSPSGGAGQYSYSWSNGSSTQSQNLGPYTETINQSSQSISVTGTVTDSENPASSTNSISCGSVTIPAGTNNNQTGNTPTLWIGNNQHVTITHIHPGNNATLGFFWPAGLTCKGAGSPVGGSNNIGWTSSTTLGNTISLSTRTGSFSLSSMQLGIYTLNLACQDSLQNATTSNTVEIDVTPSSVQEL
jgi:hypothetical protein